jgi:ABC-type polysaccharide/polyol phosphate export permease
MESTTLFATYENVIRQTSLPLSIFVMRMLWRNIIFLAHNFVIVIITVCIVWPSWSLQTLWILPGMLVVIVTVFFLSLFVATVCVRYRDIPQVIQSLMQLLFFVTPIMWQRKSLGTNEWIADINPLYHLLELLRAPLLGIAPTQLNFVVGLASAVSISLISGYVFAKSMRKIPYWL